MKALDSEEEWIRVSVSSSGGERLDRWLSAQFPDVSRSRWQKAIREGQVTREGNPLIPREPVEPGMVLLIKKRVFAVPEKGQRPPKPQDLPLEVLWEDEDLLVINKAPGMVVHPGNGCEEGTVVNAALFHCDGKLAELENPERPGIVHRLDKETSGVLLIAKSRTAGENLFTQFQSRQVNKTYLAVVQGAPGADMGTCTEPIGRHPVHRTRMAISQQGRTAVSHWEVIARSSENWAVLRVRIETGRTHQIRVHLSQLGLPILGDTLYGFRKSRSSGLANSVARVLLHAAEIQFFHPVNNVPMDIKAPVPSDLELFLPPS